MAKRDRSLCPRASNRCGSTGADEPPPIRRPASGRQRTPADGAATIYENSCSWRQIKFQLLELSQCHGLNPYVLRFARFGEPRIDVLRCFVQCCSCGTRRKRSKSVHNPAACSATRHRSGNMMVVPVGRAWASLAMGIAAGANTIKTARALWRAAARVSDPRSRSHLRLELRRIDQESRDDRAIRMVPKDPTLIS